MLRSTKDRSVVNLLRNRELNNNVSPYISSLSVISQLIRSQSTSLYANTWSMSSNRRIAYEYGLLYFSDFRKFCHTYGNISAPSSFYELEKTKAIRRVLDVIVYSVPMYKNMDEFCQCIPSQECSCLTQYIITVSEDNWMCQHKMSDGKLLKEVFIGRSAKYPKFKYCDWDVYGERFVLTSTLNPCSDGNLLGDVVVYFAVFTVLPIEFFALLKISRSVFGTNCSTANVSEQHLILGLGSTQFRIYNFEDFLKQGKRTPYKIGEKFLHGKIGYCPIGMPLNFTYNEAPPLLFDVHCGSQLVRFGGYPYHYIIKSIRDNSMCVKDLETNNLVSNGTFTSGSIDDQIDSLNFHPDHSNRLIFRTSDSVQCYKLASAHGKSQLSYLFSMNLAERNINSQPGTSLYGRKIKRVDYSAFKCNILSIDYAYDLDLFAILGTHSCNNFNGFVKLFDSISGELIRTIDLQMELCDSKIYELFVDMGCIIIIERNLHLSYTAIVCNL